MTFPRGAHACLDLIFGVPVQPVRVSTRHKDVVECVMTNDDFVSISARHIDWLTGPAKVLARALLAEAAEKRTK